jgi:hypothetical protein
MSLNFQEKYPFMIVRKSNNYINQITNLINKTQNVFNYCIIFTNEMDKWDDIDNKIHLFKYQFNEEILKKIKMRQRILIQQLEKENENYNKNIINKINLTIIFDDTTIDNIDKLYYDNKYYQLRLIYITDNEISENILRLKHVCELF